MRVGPASRTCADDFAPGHDDDRDVLPRRALERGVQAEERAWAHEEHGRKLDGEDVGVAVRHPPRVGAPVLAPDEGERVARLLRAAGLQREHSELDTALERLTAEWEAALLQLEVLGVA